MQPTELLFADGFRKTVWLYDGNIDYLKGKHIPLFMVALLLLISVSIPYTLCLIFIQCLRRVNHLSFLFWVRKLKPLFDAHTGPYKNNHSYWTGILLLIRVILFTVFTVNVTGDASVNLLSIGIVILLLLALVGGVYRSWIINAIEVIQYVNTVFLALTTYFNRSAPTSNFKVTSALSVSPWFHFLLYAYIMFT